MLKKSPTVQYLVISSESAGQRLDNFLITYLKGVPKTRIYRIVRKGEVRVNKGRAKPEYRLNEGDNVRVPPVRREETQGKTILPGRAAREAQQLLDTVLYEDSGLLVINKPAGLAVHGGSGVSFGVIELLRAHYGSKQSLELVHRLDRDTSGCLMIAKRRSTLKAMHELLQQGKVEKIYWTLVKGTWKGGKSISVPLKKNQLSSGERIVRTCANGQKSLTEFQVLENYRQATLMEAKPRTGRTHQIRVHAVYAGHPIAGDTKYGERHFNQEMQRKGIDRLFLHARQLAFQLPNHDKMIIVSAPLEKTLEMSLERLTEEKENA